MKKTISNDQIIRAIGNDLVLSYRTSLSTEAPLLRTAEAFVAKQLSFVEMGIVNGFLAKAQRRNFPWGVLKLAEMFRNSSGISNRKPLWPLKHNA